MDADRTDVVGTGSETEGTNALRTARGKEGAAGKGVTREVCPLFGGNTKNARNEADDFETLAVLAWRCVAGLVRLEANTRTGPFVSRVTAFCLPAGFWRIW